MNDDFPAFPTAVSSSGHIPGMSYRQWLAGLAMQGMLSAGASSFEDSHIQALREAAFQVADAIIKESNEI